MDRVSEIRALLTEAKADDLFAAAYARKCERWGKRVALRGLVEISNVCRKNCFYCGIRRENASVTRYRMTADEIVEACSWAAEAGFGSVVLQGGEVTAEPSVGLVEEVLTRLHARYGDALGITLSLGEQSAETYRRWRAAGAHRYLLRIESSNPELYATLHPADHSWIERRDCLRVLKSLGYIVGTGVMIGLPGQTTDDLARDIDFFREEDVDMIGMGPFIEDPSTPLFDRTRDAETRRRDERAKFELTLRMIAVARLKLKDVNLAAATALQAIDPEGREKAILAGANVIMPNVTPFRYRVDYHLYPRKTSVADDARAVTSALEQRLAALGEEIAWGNRGDPRHFTDRA